MENKQPISEYALEVISTRMDKINERLVKALVLTIILLFVSNAIWAYAWLQYDYVSTDEWEAVTVDGDNGVTTYANNGSVVNGENNSYQESAQADAN